MTAKLQLIGLKKKLRGRQVLDGVDLDVAPGKSLVIIGGSGQGKSVTLKCTLGLMKPDAGQVLVDGAEITKMPAEIRARVMRKFGMLFQGAALFDSLSVWENIAFRLIYADNTPRKEARERAIETMRKVRLAPEFADVRPIELSGGMQKRAGLARAIIAKPDILFFDEPTTGLDPITADAINDLIVEMVKELNCAAVSITHDMPSARKISDEIAMLHNGKIVWRGATSTLDTSGNAMVDQFVAGRADGPIQAVV
ncbi:ABC transporter ATP-binding protein [Vitreimonas flagellata]|uniref:ABC transporter ATP-binding protein n=1 Tax=Vitreimonas flagellata TaxID=2560861 RepID=UPI001074B497|nr:ATP-binding cassette domain-containing protein [Vitreimonas flagellata]